MKNRIIATLIFASMAFQLVACGAANSTEEPEAIIERQEKEIIEEESSENADAIEGEAVEEATAEAATEVIEPEEEPLSAMPSSEEDIEQQRMPFEGQYYAGRGNLSITGEGDDGYLIEVWWGSSASEHSQWVMYGDYDEATNTISYSDCERHDFTLKDNGEVDTDITAYTDGTGSIQIVDDSSIIWIDDVDHIADDITMTR
jgi:hypothetical protein